MPAKQTSKPLRLKALLFFVLALVILGGAGVFYLGLVQVDKSSTEVSHRLKDAEASGKQIEQLQILKAQITKSGSLIAKADQLFATPATYQSQTLNDLKNYANQVGVTITATSFEDPATTGLYSVTIKLAAPVSYKKLIQFLTLVENNLPKMQVVSIGLKHKVGGSVDDVEVGDIKINISVR